MKSAILAEKLKKIKLLIMDVDGTLTDSAMYYSPNGEELKRFSTRDGMGINLLQRAGIETAIITSENSPIVTARAEKLKIKHVLKGNRNKSDSLIIMATSLGLKTEEVAFIGDDINDIHAMKIAGASACPADATMHVMKIADYICKQNGGKGAVREFCEAILESQGKSILLPENWY